MAPVAAPLKDLNELLDFKVEEVSIELQKALDKICSIQLQEPGLRPQTLLCHDMKGGYIEDRFLEGCSDSEAYRFVHWHSIDWFVYFSHSFITIPPPGWTAAAHKNGVPVLGTLITEGPPGEELCKELFSSLRMVERSVASLASIARHHKLHGWLINIENKIDPVAIGLVVLFLQKLTAAMKTVTSSSRVVWYDSVTHEGKLRWQDELNGQNSCFYEACDAIFLNYSWSVDQLRASRLYARELPRRPQPCLSTLTAGVGGDVKAGGGGEEKKEPNAAADERSGSNEVVSVTGSAPADSPSGGAGPQHKKLRKASEDVLSLSSPAGEETKVFVGVDVFGRNFYEGGGFNTNKALEVIRSLGLSAAIFAPGWTHEVLGCSNFPANDIKFWGLLASYLQEKGPLQWPLASCFSEGCGKAHYSEGEIVDPNPWYNLSSQSLLPNVIKLNSGGRTAQYDQSEAYAAGNCLLLRNSSEQRAHFPLWSNCKLQVRSSVPLQVKLVYKWEGPPPSDGVPCSRLCSAEQSLNIDLSSDSPTTPPIDSSEAPHNGWLTRRWRCEAYDGVVSKIRVTLPPASAAKLGAIHVDLERP